MNFTHCFQKTRIGLILNEFRKKINDDRLAKRAKHLIKKWKQIMEGAAPAGKISRSENGSRKTTSQSTPPLEEPKRTKVDVNPPAEAPKQSVPERPSTSEHLPPKNPSLEPPQDDARSRSVAVIAQSLKTGSYPEGSQNPDDLAIIIEREIFLAHPSEKYQAFIRSRVFNLRDKRNPTLRENVLLGNITPERFATMPAEEMASNEMKKLRDKFTKEAINEHQMAMTEGTPSDMFKCGKCGKSNCTYNQMQTRSADEPMTTFVSP